MLNDHFGPRTDDHIYTDSGLFVFSQTLVETIFREVQQHNVPCYQSAAFGISASSNGDALLPFSGGGAWGQSSRVKSAMVWVGTGTDNSPPSAYQDYNGIFAIVKNGASTSTYGRVASVQAWATYGYSYFAQLRVTGQLSDPMFDTSLASIRVSNIWILPASNGINIRFFNTAASTKTCYYQASAYVWT